MDRLVDMTLNVELKSEIERLMLGASVLANLATVLLNCEVQNTSSQRPLGMN